MTQLTAMFFTQLKHICETSLQNSVSATVISVPAYYTDRQRHALLSAAEISHFNCIRLINEPTAAALAYGITRVSELPEKDPRNVVFIDIGHSAMTVSVAAFTKDKADVKATTFDRFIGGRVIDDILVQHFIGKIKEKHKTDVSSNPKTVLRLRLAIEKLKQVLSSNAQAALQIECLTDTLDINFLMKREEFEEICQHIFEKIISPIKVALHEAGVKKEEVHFVEIIGGSTRIPAIQTKIAQFFERPEVLSKTLNMDEAVARGCALQCAISSPLFKVRDYVIKDVTSYGIKISWDAVTGDAASTEAVLFKPNDPIPSTKALTFYRSQPFEIRAEYSNIHALPPGTSPFIGRFLIKDVVPTKDGQPSDVKIKARINESGILNIESAELIEDIVEVVAAPAAGDKTAPAPMETDKKEGEIPSESMDTDKKDEKDESGDVKMGEQMKKKRIKKDLPIVATTSKLSAESLDKYQLAEGHMIASDKLIVETLEKKNNLESYIYEMRSKIEDSHREFVSDAVREQFSQKLTETETWLYDEGDNAKKATFIEKLTELQKFGQPIVMRYREAEERPNTIADLQKAIAQYKGLAESTDPKYEHIEADDRQKVLDEVNKKGQWLADVQAEFQKLKKEDDPKTTVASIKAARESFVHAVAPIMSKPKPKPKEEPKAEPPPTTNEQPQQQTPEGQKDQTQAAPQDQPNGVHEDKKGDMDVDLKKKERDLRGKGKRKNLFVVNFFLFFFLSYFCYKK